MENIDLEIAYDYRDKVMALSNEINRFCTSLHAPRTNEYAALLRLAVGNLDSAGELLDRAAQVDLAGEKASAWREA